MNDSIANIINALKPGESLLVTKTEDATTVEISNNEHCIQFMLTDSVIQWAKHDIGDWYFEKYLKQLRGGK